MTRLLLKHILLILVSKVDLLDTEALGHRGVALLIAMVEIEPVLGDQVLHLLELRKVLLEKLLKVDHVANRWSQFRKEFLFVVEKADYVALLLPILGQR